MLTQETLVEIHVLKKQGKGFQVFGDAKMTTALLDRVTILIDLNSEKRRWKTNNFMINLETIRRFLLESFQGCLTL